MAFLSGRRIVLITNIPRPYRVPLYEAISRRIAAAGGHLRVLFYSDARRHMRRQGYATPCGHYDQVPVHGADLRLGYGRIISIPTRLLPALCAFRPDTVVSGTFGLAGYLAWLYTRLARVPYMQWSGGTSLRGEMDSVFTRLRQSFLVQHAEVYLSYGTAARDYLAELGASPERIVVGVNAVDVSFFADGVCLMVQEAEKLKKERKLNGVNLLYVGNLVQLKGMTYVLMALQRLKQGAGGFHLHLVGEGPFEGKMRAQVDELGLVDHVHFWGARPPEEVLLYYALADVFVFPSLYDVWGLVLNEAMACGLPVVASPLAGATRDLVQHGVNGLVVDPRDVSALTEALGSLIADVALRKRLGKVAATTIRNKATIEHSADAFLQAIGLALS